MTKPTTKKPSRGRAKLDQLRRISDAEIARTSPPELANLPADFWKQTGATDDLDALADLAAREGCWFHVDGAFGAMAALSPETAPIVRGMARADSITFDLHKWGYLPFGVAHYSLSSRVRWAGAQGMIRNV